MFCERFDTLGFNDPSRTYRLGLMGGTFDPVHTGHLACAEQVRDSYQLDAVVFIPAGNPVFKQGTGVAEAHVRLEMCRLAVEDNPYFDVSDIEIRRAGLTYTVDTLRALREHYPSNVEFYFITGADAVLSIIKWRESAEIARLAHLIAVTRPGFVLSDDYKATLANHADFDISYFRMTSLSISSTQLRQWVSCGRSIRYLAPQAVVDYIAEEGLYR